MAHGHRHFVPAAGHDWLLPLYDPMQHLLGGEAILRELVGQARVGPGMRVLEVGCGTGNLAVMLKRLHPEAHVVALDPDPRALARARRKARRAALAVDFEAGFAEALPFEDGAFDRVFSSFMLHHLSSETKVPALAEMRRVLAPGGSLHLLDFGRDPAHPDGLLGRLLHGSGQLRDNDEGRIPALLAEAGFVEPTRTGRRSTFLGGVAYYTGRR